MFLETEAAFSYFNWPIKMTMIIWFGSISVDIGQAYVYNFQRLGCLPCWVKVKVGNYIFFVGIQKKKNLRENKFRKFGASMVCISIGAQLSSFLFPFGKNLKNNSTHLAYCILHTVHCTLHTAHYILYSAHYTVPTEQQLHGWKLRRPEVNWLANESMCHSPRKLHWTLYCSAVYTVLHCLAYLLREGSNKKSKMLTFSKLACRPPPLF